jgi:hypothetical protein
MNKKLRWAENIPDWIKDTKVGDIVCDCSYRHQKIIEIEYTTRCPRWAWSIILRCPDWRWLEGVTDIFQKFTTYFWPRIYLVDVTLEQGNMCNLGACAHPVKWCEEASGEHVDWDNSIEICEPNQST